MIKQTINGIEVDIIRVRDRFLIIYDNEMYYTDERPYTDQEIEKMERELTNVRNEINDLNRMNEIISLKKDII